ncbi:MAG TPA: patatin-like phospholipase family protein [bacterium]|nr:patatin-like phospholipase family protein [bacterium]
MGITIIQKSDLSRKKPNAKVALVLAGGAITGGTFKIGGLKALNDFLVNRKVNDFDMFVGVSAGAFINSHLAAGVTPEEIFKILDGTSEHFEQLSPFHVYWPNFYEFFERPLSYLYRRMTYAPGILWDSMVALPRLWQPLKEGFLRFCSEPNYSNFENFVSPMAKIVYSSRSLPSIVEAMPTGIFNGANMEKYIRKNFEKNHLTNNFKVLKRVRNKSLYIITTDLDTAERVVMGPDEKNDVTISQAVQASSALPMLYKPARIKGIDYIDGAVKRTTNMDLAIRKGAELVICYNPFRPYSNKLIFEYLREEDQYVTKNRRISDSGLLMIFNQVFRTIFHTRIRYFIDQMKVDRSFKGDIILIEPKEDDSTFFEMNPFSFWNRARAARHGFASVKNTIEGRFDEISRILASYGIQMTRDVVDRDFNQMTKSSDDATIMGVLQKPQAKRRLRLVA